MPRGNGHLPRKFEPIAIIGMRGRFPGADTLDSFWNNLARGVESIASLSEEDMRACGVAPDVWRLPGYVRASPVLERVDEFDAEFFGFSARDAALTDPQHRLFLEASWEALEDAGYDPSVFPGSIGVFGGCEQSTYQYQLFLNRETLGYLDGMQLMVTNDKDHLCMQVSYRLNLRGPSVVVQTTCSTSLVAVSMACDALHAGRCDMALAGGVTVRVPQRGGYFYTPGSILSPDGHCRPFDAEAQGTIVGSGVGLVVLKPLAAALADGDNVRAVILGVGLNNDGSDKAGYTAPGMPGQASAVRSALAAAGISPATIGYVEAHGTGTIIGDPIELSALTDVYREHTRERGFCAIGSVKSNFGHLSCAAGVAGLIKTALVLEHGAIPPTVHYRQPNPAIDFVSTPFFVTQHLYPWERNGHPRRAGVSSFGVGGTNAHLVVEEAPAVDPPTERRPYQLLTVSARSADALDQACGRLADHLEGHPTSDLADVAFTQHVGRRAFRYRRSLVVRSDDRAAAIAGLRDPAQAISAVAETARPIVFTFPGQGSQYPGMAAELYETEPVVRRSIDHCAKVLKHHVGVDLRGLLFPSQRKRAEAADRLLNTEWAQPAIFVVEYATAELLRSWGISPSAMIGHSVGEFVAATLAGVMSLDDALFLIARRGRLIGSMPRGSMLTVMAQAEAVERFLDKDVSLAAVNAPGFTVLSGPSEAIAKIDATLAEKKFATRRLHTSHAFHSSMMDPILADFEECVASIRLHEPSIPFVSTLSGRWADGAVTHPVYWSKQLRSAVRFADAVRCVSAKESPAGANPLFLEVGPGRALTTFAGITLGKKGEPKTTCVASLPGADDGRSAGQAAFGMLGTLWANGVAIDWKGFHATERRRRIPLPTYPFERRSYWIGPRPDGARHELRDPKSWFYRPGWRAAPLEQEAAADLSQSRILILDEGTGVAAAVAAALKKRGGLPIVVRRAADFARLQDDVFTIDAAQSDHFGRLCAEVCQGDSQLAGLVDCWSAASPGDTDLDTSATISCLAPMRFAHALSGQPTRRPLPVLLVARGTAQVDSGDRMDPVRAFGLGVAKVIPQEHPGLRLAHVDVDGSDGIGMQLVDELAAGALEPVVALRNGTRYVEAYEQTPIDAVGVPVAMPPQPVVLITGGLGHIGLNLAEQMFARLHARVVLLGRGALPEPAQWAERADDTNLPADRRGLLGRLARMRETRDEIMVINADLNRPEQVKAAVDAAIARFGAIDVVVHGAGRVDADAFASVAETGPAVVEAHLSPKLRGMLYLFEAMKGREPKRWILHSSISSVLGGLGLGAYAGANAVLDAYAVAGGERWLSIGWDAWDNALEAATEGMPTPIFPVEGAEAFLRLLGSEIGPRGLVVVNDLNDRLRDWVRRGDGAAQSKRAGAMRHPRPNLSTPFVEPNSDTERGLAAIWAEQLGLETVGVHDRFLDLGGHSLLAVQVCSEIRDTFQVELPVLRLFQAPTVRQLAEIIDQNRGKVTAAAMATPAQQSAALAPAVEASSARAASEADDTTPGALAKASFREFYNGITRRLEESGVGDASFFLNYGYVSTGGEDDAQYDVAEGLLNASSVRLVYELLGKTRLKGKRVLDVGSGRGGTAALLAEQFGAKATGVDLAPEAVAFCRRVHRSPNLRFEVGDAEQLPCKEKSFDVVTNVESSHTYPNLRGFFVEVRRVLKPGGLFLYTDLLPVQRWAEVRVLLASLRFELRDDREITANVLASCDLVAATRAKAFGAADASIDNFLAVPGSTVYEQMRSAAWQYRILRCRAKAPVKD
ncbi:MAG: SDR family NAD(P)-dependent oxidoreductase [Proteobacteria bacterium]|nr:SDR family NAD(P)-dependent oxidoreductase [Pseudomonadota bacterium]